MYNNNGPDTVITSFGTWKRHDGTWKLIEIKSDEAEAYADYEMGYQWHDLCAVYQAKYGTDWRQAAGFDRALLTPAEEALYVAVYDRTMIARGVKKAAPGPFTSTKEK